MTKLKIKIPKNYAPSGKFDIILEKQDVYLIIDLMSVEHEKTIAIIKKAMKICPVKNVKQLK